MSLPHSARRLKNCSRTAGEVMLATLVESPKRDVTLSSRAASLAFADGDCDVRQPAQVVSASGRTKSSLGTRRPLARQSARGKESDAVWRLSGEASQRAP